MYKISWKNLTNCVDHSPNKHEFYQSIIENSVFAIRIIQKEIIFLSIGQKKSKLTYQTVPSPPPYMKKKKKTEILAVEKMELSNALFYDRLTKFMGGRFLRFY